MLVELLGTFFPLERNAPTAIHEQAEVIDDNLYYSFIKAKHIIIQKASIGIGLMSLFTSIYLIIKRKSIIK